MSGKQSGLGARFLVAGYDLSGDISALDSIKCGTTLTNGTDITQPANARIPTLRDGSMGITEFFDAANAHPVLSALPTTDQLMMFFVPPMAAGSPVACLNAQQIGYDPSRGTDASLMLKTEGQGSKYALEWALALTAGLRTDTSATGTGTALGNGAATDYGAQAYLQVTAFTGTSVTVDVEHSADDSSWSSLVSFSSVAAAPATQRVVVSNTTTVDRYLRVITTGTFTLATFAVAVNRNPVAGVSF